MNYKVLLGVLMVTAGVMVTPFNIYSAAAQKRWQCDLCPNSYKHSQHLARHLKAHRNQGKSYLCELCNKNILFNNKEGHNRDYHQEKSCLHCNQKFIGRNALDTHLSSEHKESLQVKCPVCSVRILKKHIKQHFARSHPLNIPPTPEPPKKRRKTRRSASRQTTNLLEEMPVFAPVFYLQGGQLPAQQVGSESDPQHGQQVPEFGTLFDPQGGQLPVQQELWGQGVPEFAPVFNQQEGQSYPAQQRDPLSAQQNPWGQGVPESAPVFYQLEDPLPAEQNSEQQRVEEIVNELKRLVGQNNQEVAEFDPAFYQQEDQLPVQQNPWGEEAEEVFKQLDQLEGQPQQVDGEYALMPWYETQEWQNALDQTLTNDFEV